MADRRFLDPRPALPVTMLLGVLAPPAAAWLALAGQRALTAVTCGVALTAFLRLLRRLRAALTDPVTGLPTRVGAERYLRLASGTRRTLAITDVKGLRGVNTTQGHPAGDQLLACFASALWAMRAPGDLIARLGGDEFLIITRRPADILSHDLHEALRRPVTVAGRPMRLRASTGVCPIAGGDARMALAAADIALREAKSSPDTTTVTRTT